MGAPPGKRPAIVIDRALEARDDGEKGSTAEAHEGDNEPIRGGRERLRRRSGIPGPIPTGARTRSRSIQSVSRSLRRGAPADDQRQDVARSATRTGAGFLLESERSSV